HRTERLDEVLFELDFGRPAANFPAVIVRADAEPHRGLERLYEKISTKGERVARAVFGMMFLGLEAFADDDAAVRIALEAVQDLRGVDELGHKDRRPCLRPTRLVAIDAKVSLRANGVARGETTLRVLEGAIARCCIEW